MSDVGCWCWWSEPSAAPVAPLPEEGRGPTPARRMRGHDLADRSRREVRWVSRGGVRLSGQCLKWEAPPTGSQAVSPSVGRSVGETRGEPSLQRRPGALQVLAQRILGFCISSAFIFLNTVFPVSPEPPFLFTPRPPPRTWMGTSPPVWGEPGYIMKKAVCSCFHGDLIKIGNS